MERKIAVVTGANRGLGLETARQLAARGYHVLLTGRHIRKVQSAAKELHGAGLPNCEAIHLDVSDDASVRDFHRQVVQRFGGIHVLVNNAGESFAPGFDQAQTLAAVSAALVLEAINTNTLGAYRVTQAFWRDMNTAGFGRVVNVSSGLGALTGMGGGWAAYRISKTALNAVTRLFAAEAGPNVKVNSVCPGWVRTDMGGPDADRSVEEGAAGIVWAATLPDGGPSGGFFRDGQPIDW